MRLQKSRWETVAVLIVSFLHPPLRGVRDPGKAEAHLRRPFGVKYKNTRGKKGRVAAASLTPETTQVSIGKQTSSTSCFYLSGSCRNTFVSAPISHSD